MGWWVVVVVVVVWRPLFTVYLCVFRWSRRCRFIHRFPIFRAVKSGHNAEPKATARHLLSSAQTKSYKFSVLSLPLSHWIRSERRFFHSRYCVNVCLVTPNTKRVWWLEANVKREIIMGHHRDEKAPYQERKALLTAAGEKRNILSIPSLVFLFVCVFGPSGFGVSVSVYQSDTTTVRWIAGCFE